MRSFLPPLLTDVYYVSFLFALLELLLHSDLLFFMIVIVLTIMFLCRALDIFPSLISIAFPKDSSTILTEYYILQMTILDESRAVAKVCIVKLIHQRKTKLQQFHLFFSMIRTVINECRRISFCTSSTATARVSDRATWFSRFQSVQDSRVSLRTEIVRTTQSARSSPSKRRLYFLESVRDVNTGTSRSHAVIFVSDHSISILRTLLTSFALGRALL